MKLALVALAALAVAAPAFAQAPTPSPAMAAAREKVMTACAADMKTLCDGKTGREAMMCMRDNGEKVSPDCKTAMAAMMAARSAAPQ